MPHTQAHRTHSTPCIHRHLAFTPHMDLHGPHAHHLPGNEPSFLFGEETITLGLQCTTENPQSFHFLFSCRGWQPWGLNSEVLTVASPDVQAPTCSHLCISVPPPIYPLLPAHLPFSTEHSTRWGQSRPLFTSPAPKRNFQALRTYPMKSLGAFLLLFPRESGRETNLISQPVRRRRLLILQAAMLHMYAQTHGAPKFSPFFHAPCPPSAWLNTPPLCQLVRPTQQGDL